MMLVGYDMPWEPMKTSPSCDAGVHAGCDVSRGGDMVVVLGTEGMSVDVMAGWD